MDTVNQYPYCSGPSIFLVKTPTTKDKPADNRVAEPNEKILRTMLFSFILFINNTGNSPYFLKSKSNDKGVPAFKSCFAVNP
ncbi:hypothetical protein, partial [Cobetia marina]|uniref:hypothetical protein n=1 Tax=Cobetia marina TaxID=28258 RepID=UPI0020C72DD1